MYKNKKGIFPIILGIVNFILLIPLLCMHFPRIIDSNLGFDYMGIIVGILSLLVTVLVGWNIFNTLEFKKELEQIKQQLEEKEKTLRKLIEEIEKTLKKLKKEIDDNFEEYSCKVYETYAEASIESAKISISSLLPDTKKAAISNTIGNIVTAICFYAQAEKYNDADEGIETLVLIPKEEYNKLSAEKKNQIMDKINTIPNPNKLKNYMQLSAYVFAEDKNQNTNE